ncbi:MAG: hypothetical protein FWG92_05255, partial [Leptospirales bacterium]|nr:hypothetical protein [Leptospirales bacterium]
MMARSITANIEKPLLLMDSYSMITSSVTADNYAIRGELVDGAIVFRLTGNYDPVARTYTASAASSLIRYSINGAFNESGDSLGSTATLLVRDSNTSDDWTAFTSVITESAVSISGTES